MRHKELAPHHAPTEIAAPRTADHRREIDIRVLTKAGEFKRPMRFPFQRIEVTARDQIKLFPLPVPCALSNAL